MFRPSLKKILVCTAIVAAYTLLNCFMRIHLPGISNVDLRPQIVLIFAAGYLYGPWYGFLVGIFGNFFTDLAFGYGFRYLPSWTVGNGLIGFLIGLYPYRKGRLERIEQMVWLVVTLILVNTFSLAYAAGMEILLDRRLPIAINFHYFYLPALLSNILGALIFFPVILFGLGRMKRNYPIKLSLANYYLTVVLLVASWSVLNPASFPTLLTATGVDMNQGNALVDAFNEWSFLLMILVILSFIVSSWMSKTIVTPLKQLEDTVLAVLKGDPSSAERLALFVKREDEVGILSYTVRQLSEKLWETQRLFRDDMEKRMTFMDAHDSGTDIFIVALISLFGREALGDQGDERFYDKTGEISNLSAISMIVSAGGLKELAATYSDSKIEKSFVGLDLNVAGPALSKEQRQQLALTIDMNLLFPGRLKVMDLYAPLSREFAFHLLERVNKLRSRSKNFMGYVTEPDIVGKMQEKWENSPKIRIEQLERIMNLAIGQHVIAGYQIKKQSDLAHFDINLKIAYSHSNFKHIKQLIGLLVSEDLQAKLQLELKRSSFCYHEDWTKAEELQFEILDNGVTVAHMDEFDMVMEFMTPDDRNRFQDVVEAYAKRDFMAEQTILFGSWFQPLYSSETHLEGFHCIRNIVIPDGMHIIQTYVIEEEASAKITWFQGILPDLEISTSAIWVNDAFFRYLSPDTNRAD
jgi:uncharacterized membrane protein